MVYKCFSIFKPGCSNLLTVPLFNMLDSLFIQDNLTGLFSLSVEAISGETYPTTSLPPSFREARVRSTFWTSMAVPVTSRGFRAEVVGDQRIALLLERVHGGPELCFINMAGNHIRPAFTKSCPMALRSPVFR